MIAPRRLLFAGVVDQLLPAHGGQQSQQLRRLLDLVLAEGSADEEAGEDRLADIHRVEQASEAGIDQTDTRFAADRRFVEPDELPRRLLIPGPDASDEIVKGALLGHCQLRCARSCCRRLTVTDSAG